MAGVSPRRCLGANGHRCRTRIRGASRCSECSAEHEQARETARAGTRRRLEPWRMLYGMSEWKTARRIRLATDGRACVECGTTRNVSVDHEVPLRVLWQRYVVDGGSSIDSFVAAATNPAHLRTRCATHHGLIEAERRRAS